MANELKVSTDGLRIAAANSEGTAAELATGTAEGGPGAGGAHREGVGLAADAV